MSTPNTVDRQAQFLRLILAILGALLAIAGWARFAGAQPAAPAKPAPWQDTSKHDVRFVDGFTPFEHVQAPPAPDVMNVKLGLDPGLALRTRKGTGYDKVPRCFFATAAATSPARASRPSR